MSSTLRNVVAALVTIGVLAVAQSAIASPPYPAPPIPEGQHAPGQGGAADVPPYPVPYPSLAVATVLLDSAVVKSETVQPVATLAPANGTRRCYNSSWTRSWLEVAGAKIGQVEEDQKGFCARSRQRIDTDYGWHGQSWSWGPWCITNYDSWHGWKDVPFSKQGTATGSVGVAYPWGCGGVRTIHATHVITASGRTYGKW